MPFGETKQQVETFKPQIKKTQFLKLGQGIPTTFRILDREHLDYTHYVNGTTVLCLGDDCPLCLNNKRLFVEMPKSFKNDSSFSPRTKRYSVNVLDKTMVKKCKCGLEYSDLATVNCSCGQIITTSPEPSNTVKVLSRGASLFDQLFAINDAVLDESGERVGIDKFDISLVVSGAGKQTLITPIPHVDRRAEVPAGLELYDLTGITIKLDAGEILDLQRGASLRDIFAARRAVSSVDTSAPEVSEKVREEVSALFRSASI